MLSFFEKNKQGSAARALSHPNQLLAGDMITFKDRSTLPEELQGQTLTIKQVQAYQYSEHNITPEYVLELPDGQIVNMMLDDDGEDVLTLSKALSRKEVGMLFDLDIFGELFDEQFIELMADQEAATHHPGWVGEYYNQTIKGATAYFHDTDQRDKSKTDIVYKGDSVECQYHECEGSPDNYSLTVEVWEDGDTDVYLQTSHPLTVIEEMWPNADK